MPLEVFVAKLMSLLYRQGLMRQLDKFCQENGCGYLYFYYSTDPIGRGVRLATNLLQKQLILVTHHKTAA